MLLVLPCVLRLVARSVVLDGAVQQLDVCGAKRRLNNHRRWINGCQLKQQEKQTASQHMEEFKPKEY